MNLLRDLQDDLHLTMMFVAHDLSVVEYISNRVIVMYLGRIMETGPVQDLYRRPLHPYTEALLSAAPVPDPTAKRDRIILKGDIPSPIQPALRLRVPDPLPVRGGRMRADDPGTPGRRPEPAEGVHPRRHTLNGGLRRGRHRKRGSSHDRP